MPSALSRSLGTGGGTSSSSSSSARSTGSSKEFGQMLQGSPAADAQAKPAGNASPTKPNASPGSASPNPDGSADKATTSGKDSEASTTEATASNAPTSTAAQDKDADKDTSADGDDAPWPPLGLAGLVLATPVPAEAAATAPVVNTDDGADAAAPTAAPALPTAAPLAAGAPVATAATAAAADSEGEVSTQPLPDMILGQQALDGADDGDSLQIGDRTPPTPLQAALPAALQDLKAALSSTPVFKGEPTPTPTLGDDGFDQAIGARLGWLADQKIGHAHIRLNPEDLGPVDVRLQMNGDKVHASFSSPHVDVRQALESSLPRLRELLGEQGFQLAHADVGNQGSGDGSPSGQAAGGGDGLGGGDGEPSRGDATMSAAQLIRQRGLLDAYA